MTFDLDTAWRDARRYLTENAGLLAIMGGIFVFLPYAAVMVLMPLAADMPQIPEGANFNVTMEALNTFYGEVWWMLLLVSIIVTVGQLAMLALLGRKPHPTVGEAIGIGAKAILPAWLAFLLQTLAINFIVLAIILVATALGSPPFLFVATVLALVLAIYLFIRLSLVLPIAAVEGNLNPVQMLTNSWKRTKGHGLRLMSFFLLVGIAAIIVAMVFTMVAGLILSLFGASVAEAIGVILSAAVMAALIVLFTAVLAAAYAQLRRLSHSGGITGPHTAHDPAD